MTLGEDHLSTLISRANLAWAYRNRDWLKDAERLQKQVTEMITAKLGANNPNTLTSIANLASTYWS